MWEKLKENSKEISEENLSKTEEIFRKFREIHDSFHYNRPDQWKVLLKFDINDG